MVAPRGPAVRGDGDAPGTGTAAAAVTGTGADAGPAAAGAPSTAAAAATPPPLAWGPLLVLGGALALVLVAFAGRYGYHRDELYFLAAGQHLAWGYPDQPPLTPLLARAATEVLGDSLVGLRVLPALMAGATVVLTGAIARELGAGAGRCGAQALAGACVAVSATMLVVSHMLSTTAVDVLVWTALSWLGVRALRLGGRTWAAGGRTWVAFGLVAGVGLQNKTLVAFLLGALALSLLVAGPRGPLRRPWPWLAGAVALALWAPNLAWQAANGWPQLELSAAIAAGGSGTSMPRWAFLPFQLLLVSPALVPVWVAGWWRLAREPAARPYRAFALAYALLAAVFLVTGGKPYYLFGLYPVLLAAGAEPTLRWVARARSERTRTVVVALALSLAIAVVLMLPVLPARWLASTPITDVNYDGGETVGWPRLVATVARVHDDLPASERAGAVVLTRNYGQAGAIDRFGGPLGLPRASSGHNGYGSWGPPPASSGGTTITVGYDDRELARWFGACSLAARVDNGVGLDNDEQGAPVRVCRERLAPWERLWPDVVRLG